MFGNFGANVAKTAASSRLSFSGAVAVSCVRVDFEVVIWSLFESQFSEFIHKSIFRKKQEFEAKSCPKLCGQQILRWRLRRRLDPGFGFRVSEFRNFGVWV